MQTRYCNLTATDIHSLLSLCQHHIKNTFRQEMDMVIEGGYTATDKFYVEMIRGILKDFESDIQKIIEGKKGV